MEALLHFSLDRAVGGIAGLPDEEIDDVIAPLVDQGRHRLIVDVIQAAPLQGKSLVRKVAYRRGKVYLAIEPRLDGVTVRGFDVGYVSKQQLRADMTGH